MQEKNLVILSEKSTIELPSHLCKSYIVCSTPRSGSTLVCSILSQLGFLGKPQEFFHQNILEELKLLDNPEGLINYLNRLFQNETTQNGVFATKIHYEQLVYLIKIAKKLPEFKDKTEIEILNSIFPELQFIYIWRRDTIKQAISLEIALQSGSWWKPIPGSDQRIMYNSISQKDESNTLGERKKIDWKFNPLKIYLLQKKLEHNNCQWIYFFKTNSLYYYEVIYENFVKAIKPTITEITEFLELDTSLLPHTMPVPTKKQSSEINEKWLRQYKKIPKIFLKVANKIFTLKRQIKL